MSSVSDGDGERERGRRGVSRWRKVPDVSLRDARCFQNQRFLLSHIDLHIAASSNERISTIFFFLFLGGRGGGAEFG